MALVEKTREIMPEVPEGAWPPLAAAVKLRSDAFPRSTRRPCEARDRDCGPQTHALRGPTGNHVAPLDSPRTQSIPIKAEQS